VRFEPEVLNCVDSAVIIMQAHKARAQQVWMGCAAACRFVV